MTHVGSIASHDAKNGPDQPQSHRFKFKGASLGVYVYVFIYVLIESAKLVRYKNGKVSESKKPDELEPNLVF